MKQSSTRNKQHERFMQRCLNLANIGTGSVSPNPKVGCCITFKGRIIGEGYHRKFGGRHAEVEAISAITPEDRQYLAKSTLYVNLEPCAHQGKTPPCANMIIEHGIPEVVVGMIDPYKQVSGAGIKRLQDAGVKVTVGILEKKCQAVNRPFVVNATQERAYCTLKWATSADGFMGEWNKRTALSGPQANRITHKLRSEVDAVLIGANTAVIDRPKLSTRHFPGKNPLRVILDIQGRISADNPVFRDDHALLFTKELRPGLSDGIQQIVIDKDFLHPEYILSTLYQQGVGHLLVEGGASTTNEFIRTSAWDDALVISGTSQLRNGVQAPCLNTRPLLVEQAGHDLISYYTNNGPEFSSVKVPLK